MKNHLLSSLEDHWEELRREGQELHFQKGQILFYEDHQPYGLFVLREGKVKFMKEECPCHEEHLCRSLVGPVLGLHPFIDGISYSCTCKADEDCRVVFISKTLLAPFLGSSP